MYKIIIIRTLNPCKRSSRGEEGGRGETPPGHIVNHLLQPDWQPGRLHLFIIIAGCLETIYFTVRGEERITASSGNNILVGFIIGRAMAGWLLAGTAAVSHYDQMVSKLRVQLPPRRRNEGGNNTT